MKPSMDVYIEKKISKTTYILVCKHYSCLNFPSLSSVSKQLDAFTCFSYMGKLIDRVAENHSLQINSTAANANQAS